MALCAKHPRAVFLGQACRVGGTAMHGTLARVPMEMRVEMPVAENLQLGMATGVALAGGLPVCLFPRVNFLLEAVSQLVSHLDKLPLYSDGGYRPRVLIRTAIASPEPLDPGPQHLGDYTAALSMMLTTVKVRVLEDAEAVLPAYRGALEFEGSTLLVEYLGMYGSA